VHEIETCIEPRILLVIHEIKIKEMFKNIKKKEVRMLIKINKDIHSEMKIKKIE